jgi:hypothetical protein
MLQPLFADASSSFNQGYQQGLVIGHYLGIAIMLGIVVFTGFALVQAVRKRTKGWIITASILGSLVALPVVVGIGIGVVRGIRNAQSAQGAGADDTPVSAGPEAVTGKSIAYHMVFPPGWTLKEPHKNFDTLAMSKNLYVGVSAEEVDVGTSAIVARIALKKVNSVGTDVQSSQPKEVSVDGQPWMEFTCRAHINDIPFSYLFLVHSGPEGTYQLVGWTFQNVFDRDVDKLRSVMTTFKFPPVPVSAKPSGPSTASHGDPDTNTPL